MIPLLPAAWLESVQAEKWQDRNVNDHASIPQVVAWMEKKLKGYAHDACAAMGRAIEGSLELQEEEEENQHDIMNRRVMYHINLAFEGHSGLERALHEVKQKYIEMVYERRARAPQGEGKMPRLESECTADFLRSRDGGIRILMAEEEAPVNGCSCLSEPERPEDENAPGFYAKYQEPEHYRDTDLGLAEHFFDLHKWDFAWLTEAERWILWDGVTWKRDGNLQINRMAQDVGHRLYEAADALQETVDKMIKAGQDVEEMMRRLKMVRGRAKEAHQAPRIKRILETARGLEDVARSISTFDADFRLLGTPEGVLELGEDGSVKLRPGTRGDRITRSTRVPYVAGATHKELNSFLRTFIPDMDVRRYLQKFLGYSLLGKNEERKIAFFVGESSSGKSTLLEAVIAMMGDYGSPLPLSIFNTNNSDKPRPDIIAAKPRRIIATSELDAKTPIHADALKRLVSTDTQSVRGMHKDDFDNREHAFTPFIATNVTPSVPGADRGFRQRLAVFPFNQSLIGTGRIDPKAGDRFRSDPEILTALLAWMVDGYAMYGAEGLEDVPDCMSSKADSFMAGTNHFQRWFITNFIKEEGSWLSTDEIKMAYETWCETESVHLSERLGLSHRLPAALEDAGFKKGKVRKIEGKATRTREGFRFRTEREKRQVSE